LSAEPKRCTKQTAPQRAPAGAPGQRRRRLVSIARNAMRRTRPSRTGSRCRKNAAASGTSQPTGAPARAGTRAPRGARRSRPCAGWGRTGRGRGLCRRRRPGSRGRSRRSGRGRTVGEDPALEKAAQLALDVARNRSTVGIALAPPCQPGLEGTADIRVWPGHVDQLKIVSGGLTTVPKIEPDHPEKESAPRAPDQPVSPARLRQVHRGPGREGRPTSWQSARFRTALRCHTAGEVRW
jgi:hypothetical protein